MNRSATELMEKPKKEDNAFPGLMERGKPDNAQAPTAVKKTTKKPTEDLESDGGDKPVAKSSPSTSKKAPKIRGAKIL